MRLREKNNKEKSKVENNNKSTNKNKNNKNKNLNHLRPHNRLLLRTLPHLLTLLHKVKMKMSDD